MHSRALTLACVAGIALLLALSPSVASETLVSDGTKDVQVFVQARADDQEQSQALPLPAQAQEALAPLDVTKLTVEKADLNGFKQLNFTLQVRRLDDRDLAALAAYGDDQWNVDFVDDDGNQYRFQITSPIAVASPTSKYPDMVDFNVNGQSTDYTTGEDSPHAWGFSTSNDMIYWTIGLLSVPGEQPIWSFQGATLKDFEIRVRNTGSGFSTGDPLPEHSVAAQQFAYDEAGPSGVFGQEGVGPELSVDIESDAPLDAAKPGRDVDYQLTVKNTAEIQSPYVFNLTAPEGWSYTIEPPNQTLRKGQSTTVNLTVSTPSGVEKGFYALLFRVSDDDGELVADTGLITRVLSPQHVPELEVEDVPVANLTHPRIQVVAGETAKMDVRLVNLPLANRTFELSLTGDNDWLELGTSTVSLLKGESTTVTLKADVPSNASADEYRYTLTAEPNNASAPTRTLPITLNVGIGTLAEPAGAKLLPGFELVAALAAAGAAALARSWRGKP